MRKKWVIMLIGVLVLSFVLVGCGGPRQVSNVVKPKPKPTLYKEFSFADKYIPADVYAFGFVRAEKADAVEFTRVMNIISAEEASNTLEGAYFVIGFTKDQFDQAKKEPGKSAMENAFITGKIIFDKELTDNEKDKVLASILGDGYEKQDQTYVSADGSKIAIIEKNVIIYGTRPGDKIEKGITSNADFKKYVNKGYKIGLITPDNQVLGSFTLNKGNFQLYVSATGKNVQDLLKQEFGMRSVYLLKNENAMVAISLPFAKYMIDKSVENGVKEFQEFQIFLTPFEKVNDSYLSVSAIVKDIKNWQKDTQFLMAIKADKLDTIKALEGMLGIKVEKEKEWYNMGGAWTYVEYKDNNTALYSGATTADKPSKAPSYYVKKFNKPLYFVLHLNNKGIKIDDETTADVNMEGNMYKDGDKLSFTLDIKYAFNQAK